MYEPSSLWYLLGQYLSNAPVLFGVQICLLAGAVMVWRRDLLTIRYETRWASHVTDSIDPASKIHAIAHNLIQFAEKGQPQPLLAPDIYQELFETSETSVQSLISALLYTGLIGTLYTLWRLGPAFWKGVFSVMPPGAPETDFLFAFAASLVGIFLALCVNLVESLALVPRRMKLATAAANIINLRALGHTTDRSEKIIQDAVAAFEQRAERQLEVVERSIATLYSRASGEITGAMADVTSRLDKFALEWTDFWQQNLTQIHTTVGELRDACQGLQGVLPSTQEALQATTRGAAAVQSAAEYLSQTTEGVGRRLEDQLVRLQNAMQQAMEAAAMHLDERLSATHARYIEALHSGAADLQRNFKSLLEDLRNESAAAIRSLNDALRNAASAVGTQWGQRSVEILAQFADTTNRLDRATDRMAALAEEVAGLSSTLRRLADEVRGRSRSVDRPPPEPPRPEPPRPVTPRPEPPRPPSRLERLWLFVRKLFP